MRKCPRCGYEAPDEEFPVNRKKILQNGEVRLYKSYCKKCLNARKKPEWTKKCDWCWRSRDAKYFPDDARSADGKANRCGECKKTVTRLRNHGHM